MNTLILGIDPGLKGAAAVYDTDTKLIIELFDLPTETKSATKRQVDGNIMAFRLEPYRGRMIGAVIEDVGARPGQGVTSMFNFGLSTGIVVGVVQSMGIRIFRPTPAVWKMNMGCGSDKNLSLKVARAQFPTQADLFTHSKYDGRAEAALLAKYGERIFKGATV